MKNKIKIAMVVAETAPIPDVHGGGAERLVTMLINQNEVNQRVNFIVASKYDKQAKELSNKYKLTKFIYVQNNRFVVKIFNFFVRIINLRFNKKLKKHGYYDVIANKIDSDCDIIIDQNGYCNEIGFLSDRFGKKRILAHIHWMVNPSQRHIEDCYGGVIGVSYFITNYWLENSKKNSVEGLTVYSAVDEKRFLTKSNDESCSSILNKYRILETDFVFVYCGRLHAQKGVKELIQAFIQLNLDNCKLLIVGGSYLKNSSKTDYETEIRKLAEKHKNIIFTGFVNNEELCPIYNIADVQVIPTLTEEAAGLVAIEGLYCGLPIIATKSGGLPEYLDDQCSIIVDKGINVVNNLASAMKLLYVNGEKREKMSRAAFSRAKLYTQEKFYNDFVDTVEHYMKTKGF